MVFGDETENILLKPNPDRFTLFPIQHDRLWQMYKKAQAAYWTVSQIDLASDLFDWENKLNDDERLFIKKVLAFFAQSDAIVNENLAQNMYNEVQLPEARCFYGFQIMMENVHAEMYSTMIEAFITDPDERKKALHGIENYPCVKRKADWALKWLNSKTATFAERLIAFAAVEGIFFSSSFCSIFWLKKRGLMSGLCISNEYISRDECLHQDFAALEYSMIPQLSKERVLEIIMEAVEIEKEFARDVLQVRLIGMNASAMSEYIEFVTDILLQDLIGEKRFNTRNPFDFMDLMILRGKANFFERHVSEYEKVGVLRKETSKALTFTDDY